MADLVSIQTLAGKFNDEASLVAYTNNQYKTIERLKNEVKELKLQLEHTKALLVSTAPLVGKADVIKINVTDEENICLIQINKLQDKATNRDLTLEETKKLEILVKSLYLIREKSVQDLSAEYKTLNASSIAELEHLAKSTDD